MSFSFRSRPITPTGTKPLTTGEDTTPQLKKRRLSGNIALKTGGTASGAANAVGNGGVIASPSVHKLFATEFFSNISKGYDILLHTFQYLKVQVGSVRF